MKDRTDYYIGLDVSQKQTSICVIDGEGKQLCEGKSLTRPQDIHGWLGNLRLQHEAKGPFRKWSERILLGFLLTFLGLCALLAAFPLKPTGPPLWKYAAYTSSIDTRVSAGEAMFKRVGPHFGTYLFESARLNQETQYLCLRWIRSGSKGDDKAPEFDGIIKKDGSWIRVTQPASEEPFWNDYCNEQHTTLIGQGEDWLESLPSVDFK